jgi:hypothetical protein
MIKIRFFATFLLVAFCTITVLTSCNNNANIVGQWKVTEMRADVRDVPQILIDNAEKIALSVTYEFFSDGQFIMHETHDNIVLRFKGRATVNSRRLILNIDSIFSLFTDGFGDWDLVEKNNFNTGWFEPREISIEKMTSNQIILSSSELQGKIYYTLRRVE